ncbi:TusC [Haemophilus influenzae]|uniref:TusC n=1 Tax=Haemophilus influenzae TaxID=727 RepID=A0A2X1RHJ1_HAEIF|nr:TusC [Haemophilus influenzae]
MQFLPQQLFVIQMILAYFFIDDGILNLINHQQPEIIQQKDFIRTFKLLNLYDVEQRFICTESLQKFKLEDKQTHPIL